MISLNEVKYLMLFAMIETLTLSSARIKRFQHTVKTMLEGQPKETSNVVTALLPSFTNLVLFV